MRSAKLLLMAAAVGVPLLVAGGGTANATCACVTLTIQCTGQPECSFDIESQVCFAGVRCICRPSDSFFATQFCEGMTFYGDCGQAMSFAFQVHAACCMDEYDCAHELCTGTSCY